MRRGGCIVARPGELLASSISNFACLGELVTSAQSFLVGLGAEKCPKSDPFALLLSIFAHFLLKCQKTLRIVRKLVLSSSIRLARIQTFSNDHPQTKLGYDTLEKTFILQRMNLKEDGLFTILRVQTKNKSKTNFMSLSKESKFMSFSLIGFMLIPLETT